MKRREFLGASATAILATQAAYGEETPVKARPKKVFSDNPLALVDITDKVKATRIGFGTGMRGSQRQSDITRMDRKKAVELLQFAYDKGIRLFDMADLYGSHQVVAEALAGKPREELTYISKIWQLGGGIPEPERPEPEVVIKRFLKELNTDYIDIVQIHCMMNANWAKDQAKVMDGLEKCKEQGLILAHGCSCHSNNSLEVAAKTPWTDVVHIRINSEGANMDGKVADVQAVAEKVHDAGVGTIAMKVLGEGKFADKPELRKKSIEFLLGLEYIDVMVAAFSEKEHITEFIENVAQGLKKRKNA